jgi:hypothetical protein
MQIGKVERSNVTAWFNKMEMSKGVAIALCRFCRPCLSMQKSSDFAHPDRTLVLACDDTTCASKRATWTPMDTRNLDEHLPRPQ